MINPKHATERMFLPGGIEPLKDNKLHYVDLHIIDGCNLKCARCFKFSPLCDNKDEMDFDKVAQDIKDLAILTNREIDGISVIGGEPLIASRLLDYLKLVRKELPNTDITIITNGIAIPNMENEFFELLKELNVMLAISRYFEKDFYEKIEKVMAEHNCQDRYVYSQIAEMGCVLFLQMELDEDGNSDMEEIWNLCSAKNGCVLLKDGKLWSCSNGCMKYILNRKFGTNLIDYEEDGIEIKNHTLDEVIEHLKKPKKCCRYCTKDIYKCMYFPQPSSLDKSEWIREKK